MHSVYIQYKYRISVDIEIHTFLKGIFFTHFGFEICSRPRRSWHKQRSSAKEKSWDLEQKSWHIGTCLPKFVSSRFEFCQIQIAFLIFFRTCDFSRNIFMFQVDIWCLCKHIWTGLQRFDASILTTSHKTDVMYFWYIIDLYEIYTINIFGCFYIYCNNVLSHGVYRVSGSSRELIP